MFDLDNLLTVHKQATILIPNSIVTVLNGILSGLRDKGSEYGIYLKGTLDKQTMTMRISEEYMIPEQEVTNVTIDFKQSPPSNDWNVVLHRHPDGVTRFSGTDESSINKEFDASLLFIPPFSFPQAILNLEIDVGLLVQIPARVIQVANDGEQIDVSMIKQKLSPAFSSPRKTQGSGLKLKRKVKPRPEKLVVGEGAFGEFADHDAESLLALEQEMEEQFELENDLLHEEDEVEDDNPLFAHLNKQ